MKLKTTKLFIVVFVIATTAIKQSTGRKVVIIDDDDDDAQDAFARLQSLFVKKVRHYKRHHNIGGHRKYSAYDEVDEYSSNWGRSAAQQTATATTPLPFDINRCPGDCKQCENCKDPKIGHPVYDLKSVTETMKNENAAKLFIKTIEERPKDACTAVCEECNRCPKSAR